jgi:hypothetical protein
MSKLLTGTKLLACEGCGWVHYAMSDDERAGLNSAFIRYRFSKHEQETCEAGFQRCVRCESSASGFRQANKADIERALNHLITPVLTGTL